MPHYDITYACGHKGTVSLTGPSKTREWLLSKKEGELCPECYKKHLEEQRAAERDTALKEAEEQELPDLVGTEKQVAWAVTIRAKYLTLLDEALPSIKLSDKVDSVLFQETIESIQNETSASWWIDNGRVSVFDMKILVKRYRELLTLRETTGHTSVEEATTEATVRPESPVSELPVEIQIKNEIIFIKYPERNDTFIEIVKGKGFTWQGESWTRQITKFAGTMEDRAGEMGNLLLHAGFIIQIFDEVAREKAISGNYEPEQIRWIKVLAEGKYAGYFSLTWERGNEKIYDASRSVAGSRWNKPAVVIPAAQYEAVLDLADEFGFKLSPGAQGLVEEARQRKEESLVVKPGDAPEPVKKQKSTPGEIDDDLRDDN